MPIIQPTAFKTWFEKFSNPDPIFENSENADAESIVNFLATESDNPLPHFSISLRDEQGILLGIDSSLQSMVLLHNLEILPASRHTPNPVVRALHGFGREATPVLLTRASIELSFTHSSPSITAIRQALKDGVTDLSKLTNPQSELKTRCLVLLPPFIAKALMAMPTLSCHAVFETVMTTIATYDKESKATSDKEAKTSTDKEAKPATTVPPDTTSGQTDAAPEEEDPIVDSDDEDFVDVKKETDKTKKPSPKTKTAPKQPSTASTKKPPKTPSTFTNCATLIKFCFFAQHQELHYDTLKAALIDGVAVRPTHELAHKEWSAFRHVQAGIDGNRAESDGTNIGAASLFDRVADPLNEIKNCLEAIRDKETDMDTSTDDSKTKIKLDKALIVMFRRLSTTTGIGPADNITDFLAEFLSKKGTGGTGAAQFLALHNKRLHRSINMPIGCITAMHQGNFLWDHPTIPNNFSAFYTPRVSVEDLSRTANNDLMNVHLRALVGKGIENGDISKITKQFMTIPGSVPDMIKQLTNHNALQGDFWGQDSMIHIACAEYIKGLHDYETVYEAACMSDASFLAKVTYFYDLTVYRLYEECLVKSSFQDIRWELADLQKAHTKVLCGQFYQNLPPNLLPPPTKKRVLPDADVPPDVRIKQPKGTQLVNQHQQKTLMLEPNEPFNEVILRTQQLKLLPNWPSNKQSICLNWHINGRCNALCERKGSHKSLPAEILGKAEAFLKAARAAHKKNQEKK
jgi:hypothetical protein